jgi:hypothetical protein
MRGIDALVGIAVPGIAKDEMPAVADPLEPADVFPTIVSNHSDALAPELLHGLLERVAHVSSPPRAEIPNQGSPDGSAGTSKSAA